MIDFSPQQPAQRRALTRIGGRGVPAVELPTVTIIYLFGGGRLAISSEVHQMLTPTLGGWGWQIANVHLPVGHEAARGNAASPSMQNSCDAPAVFFAVDMGVGAPKRGF